MITPPKTTCRSANGLPSVRTIRALAAMTAISLGSAAEAQISQGYECVMDPSRVVELGAPAPGILTEVRMRRGQPVKRGDVVARIDSRVEEATVALLETRANATALLESQKARRDLVKSQFDRTAELADRNVASAGQLDMVAAELLAADAQVEQALLEQRLAAQELTRARTSLELTQIRAPITGVVLDRVRDVGEFVSADRQIATIVTLDPLTVEAFLPVDLYPDVRIGDTASVVPMPPFENVHAATIIAVDQVFDAASRTFGIALELPNGELALPAGHRCTLLLVAQE